MTPTAAGSGWHLAQVNVGRLREPLDHPQMAAFVEALDPVNAAADQAPGFVWRLQTDEGNATAVAAFTWDAEESAGVIINLSVWTDVERLIAFVHGDLHRAILRRRREFFYRMTEPYLACWWVPEGHLPSTDEAEERVRHLRANGPTPFAFTLRHHFPPPDHEVAAEVLRNDDDRSCPA
ncbi:MAG TPA: DUF3291 domain-containing protein [Acidimicrobiales bacterium]|nr:DUF3291 domain-containing protein [Acidimicrobiales bacterium]